MKVRLADPERDRQAVLGVLREMSAEPGPFAVSWPKVLDQAERVLGEGLVLLAELDDEAVGSFGAMASEPWNSTDNYLQSFWCWVKPEVRRTRARAMLVEEAAVIAARLELRLGLAAIDPTEIKNEARFYSRYMTPMGVFFMSR